MCASKRNAEFFKINNWLSLRSSYEILGPHPCTRIRVRAMIGLLKGHCQFSLRASSPIWASENRRACSHAIVSLPIKLKGKFETHFCQFVDIGAAWQTLLTWVRLRLRLRAALDYEYMYSPFFLRDSRASETWACVKITPHEKGETRRGQRKIFLSRCRV